jgi:hypothetical protein
LIGNSTKKEAETAAKTQLAQGLIGAVQTVASGMFGGGILGQIAGPLVGGALGLGLSKLFKLGKSHEREVPDVYRLINSLDFIKMFTLPNSAYLAPTGRNIGPVNLTQTNNMSIGGGAKVASRVQQALDPAQLIRQLNLGLT